MSASRFGSPVVVWGKERGLTKRLEIEPTSYVASYLTTVSAFGRLCGHTTQLTLRLATLLNVNVLLVVFSFPLVSPLVFTLHIMSGFMKTVLKNWNRALSGRFFLAKGDDIKVKRKVSPVFLPLSVYLPFIALLSLFLPVYMAWIRPKSLVKSRWNKGDRGRIVYDHFHKSRQLFIYVYLARAKRIVDKKR